MNKQIITLSGFGDFSETPETYEEIKTVAKRYGIEFYPTYYDHELKGDKNIIEKITMEIWGMPSDQWSENLLNETIIK